MIVIGYYIPVSQHRSISMFLCFSQSGQGYTCVLIELTLYLREAFDHLVHRLVTSKSIAGLRERERRPICAYFVRLSLLSSPPHSFVTIFGGVSSFHPSQRWVGGACVLFLNCSASDSLLRVGYSPLNITLKCSASFKLWKTSLPTIKGASPVHNLPLQSLSFFLLLPFVSLFSHSPSLVVPLPVLKAGLDQTVKTSTLHSVIQHSIQFYFEEQINICVVL